MYSFNNILHVRDFLKTTISQELHLISKVKKKEILTSEDVCSSMGVTSHIQSMWSALAMQNKAVTIKIDLPRTLYKQN